MKSIENIGRVLPVQPYAHYESECTTCKSSAYPTKLYFVRGQPYKRFVAPLDFNIFYVNLSHDKSITGCLSKGGQDHSFEALPGQLVTIVPSRTEISYEVDCDYQQAILCVHQSILNDKASELSRGEFNHAEVEFTAPVDSPLLCSVVREIEHIQTDRVESSSVYLESLYDVVMAKVMSRYTTMKKGLPSFKMHSPAHMKKVLDYIFDNLDQDIKVATLAAKMNLSHYHFTRIFKDYLGLSPYQYILNMRFERSKELLLETEMSLVAIANALGFSSQSHFQSFFKKQAGITPREFRSNNQKTK